jgi:hypothetical protein
MPRASTSGKKGSMNKDDSCPVRQTWFAAVHKYMVKPSPPPLPPSRVPPMTARNRDSWGQRSWLPPIAERQLQEQHSLIRRGKVVRQ